jgi:hypothetical protein
MPQKPTVLLICQNPKCQKPFLLAAYPVKKGRGKYCSESCRHYLSMEERFWAKVQKTATCWLWTGYKRDNRYGEIALEHRGSPMRAHVYSYVLHFGPFFPGFFVLHHCDTPPCVRPTHLFLGTQGDNIQDAKNKHRLRGPSNLFGENNPSAKLTDPQIYEIRALQGILSASETGRRYQIAYQNITRIWDRTLWGHLP